MDPQPPIFEADPLLDGLDTPVLGLNVAFHWPLPAAFRAGYDRLRGLLLALDPGVYVYPFEQTHVTVATIVSFKRHERPDSVEQDRILSIVPRLANVLDDACATLPPFEIDVGAPVLVPAAAFLPITNPTGEVAAVRRHLSAAGAFPELQIPRAIHATMLRFRRPPRDAGRFARHFEDTARAVRFGKARVHSVLVTTETRRYMMAGRIVHQVPLKLPSST
jgi:hypothetical protein